MIIKYKIDNGSKADAIVDIPNDTMSAPSPPPKYIIINNFFINYEQGYRT